VIKPFCVVRRRNGMAARQRAALPDLAPNDECKHENRTAAAAWDDIVEGTVVLLLQL